MVGLRVRDDLFVRQRRARRIAAAGIADLRREVANQENHGVPQILKLTHLVQHHGMAEMNVRRRGVQAELDAKGGAGGPAAGQFAGKFRRDEQFIATPLGNAQIVGDPGIHGV